MTSPKLEMAAASTMPSREFFVRQALTTAMSRLWPYAIQNYGLPSTLRLVGYATMNPEAFSCTTLAEYFRDEYRALIARYKEGGE